MFDQAPQPEPVGPLSPGDYPLLDLLVLCASLSRQLLVEDQPEGKKEVNRRLLLNFLAMAFNHPEYARLAETSLSGEDGPAMQTFDRVNKDFGKLVEEAGLDPQVYGLGNVEAKQ